MYIEIIMTYAMLTYCTPDGRECETRNVPVQAVAVGKIHDSRESCLKEAIADTQLAAQRKPIPKYTPPPKIGNYVSFVQPTCRIYTP